MISVYLQSRPLLNAKIAETYHMRKRRAPRGKENRIYRYQESSYSVTPGTKLFNPENWLSNPFTNLERTKVGINREYVDKLQGGEDVGSCKQPLELHYCCSQKTPIWHNIFVLGTQHICLICSNMTPCICILLEMLSKNDTTYLSCIGDER